MPPKRLGMAHLNGSILCAVDTETSGDVAGHHDLLQICCLALDYKLDPWPVYMPFYNLIVPKRPDTFDPQSRKVSRLRYTDAMLKGIEAYKAADMFEEWFQNLGMAPGCKIVPLAQNWPHDRQFLIDWLGKESFEYYFDARYRDTMVTANFCNDLADFTQEPLPYAKTNLAFMCSTLGIDYRQAHDPLNDCLATAEVYKRIMKGSPNIATKITYTPIPGIELLTDT